MSFFKLFNRKKEASNHSVTPRTNAREEIYKNIFEKMAQKSPSEHFASGAVFDILRQQREVVEQIIRSNDSTALLNWFVNAYNLFCTNPGVVGFTPAMVNTNNNDVKINEINADCFNLQNGDAGALCFMPIVSDEYAARIIGIVLGKEYDGYFYCMLDKDENVLSNVMRNKAMHGVEIVGEVNGSGVDLIHSFLGCILDSFYS